MFRSNFFGSICTLNGFGNAHMWFSTIQMVLMVNNFFFKYMCLFAIISKQINKSPFNLLIFWFVIDNTNFVKLWGHFYIMMDMMCELINRCSIHLISVLNIYLFTCIYVLIRKLIMIAVVFTLDSHCQFFFFF